MGVPIDEITIQKKIQDNKPHLLGLFTEILTRNPLSDPKFYLDILIEDYQKRELLTLEHIIKKSLITDKLDASKAKSILLKEVNKIDQRGNYTNSNIDTEKEIDILLQSHMNSLSENTEERFTFGIEELDSLVETINKKDLVIVGGRPASGKTAFLCNTALNVLKRSNHSILICTHEMTSAQLLERLIINESGKSLDEHKAEGFYGERYRASISFMKTVKDRLRFYEDFSNPNGTKVANHIRYVLLKDKSIKNVFLDHLEELSYDTGANKRDGLAIGAIIRDLKNIAKEFDVRFFLLTQLNREVEKRDNKRPRKSDIKNTGVGGKRLLITSSCYITLTCMRHHKKEL